MELATLAATLASVLALLNIITVTRTLLKDWRARRHAPAHPLEPALRDIAQSIRDLGNP